MPEINVDIEFEVYCNTCGKGLCGESEVVDTYNRSAKAVRVNACPDCISSEYDRGHDEGYQEGYSDKEKEGE